MVNMSATDEGFVPIICVVDFHHARGPEIEQWFGVEENEDPAIKNDWSLLPFLALPDGAHDAEEEFSYFTLRQAEDNGRQATSLFGIACTRHTLSRELLHRPAEVTRSSVQKSIVIVVDSPYVFARVKEQLSVVTKAWFAQQDFRDTSILSDFQKSLLGISKVKDDERDQFVGLSLREMIHEYKQQTLVLFKCALLQPKMLFFGTACEKMCLLQFSLISLIPGLLRKLQDCADPDLKSNEESLSIPTSLRTSDRSSLLTYMGLPLQIFGKGAFFGPYTPLQQLDMLSDAGTTSYIAGSTNPLVLQQKEKYCDMLVNLDTQSIDVHSGPLKPAVALSAADKKWIDFLIRTVNDTWDPSDPTRPTTHGYLGSEEFIRFQFEEYILALLASLKYRRFAASRSDQPSLLLADTPIDPTAEWSATWVSAWEATDNARIFSTYTDSHLFDVVAPKHPCAGAGSIEDLQRRVTQQVADLHLDEKLRQSREVIGAGLATGGQRVSAALNTMWANAEVMRENQRRRREDSLAASTSESIGTASTESEKTAVKFPAAPDLAQAQAQVQAAGARAGAYLSSWGSWAKEKRQAGWGRAVQTGEKPAESTVNTTTATEKS